MLTKEYQVEIEVLHRQGKGIREIARETGIARNTVRAVLRGVNDNQYGPRVAPPARLDAYKEYVRERIERAGKTHLSAMVLLREIRTQGYVGGVTQLKEYLRSIRPRVPDEPIIRFETEPGSQLQIDFVVFRRGVQPLRAFTAELGYSRYAYVEFTDNERSETLIGCLERALAFFGGVPSQILCDNPKTIVIERNAYAEGKHRFNRQLLDVVRSVSSADEGEGGTLSSLFARLVLLAAANRSSRARRRCDCKSRSANMARRDCECPHSCDAQRTAERPIRD